MDPSVQNFGLTPNSLFIYVRSVRHFFRSFLMVVSTLALSTERPLVRLTVETSQRCGLDRRPGFPRRHVGSVVLDLRLHRDVIDARPSGPRMSGR